MGPTLTWKLWKDGTAAAGAAWAVFAGDTVRAPWRHVSKPVAGSDRNQTRSCWDDDVNHASDLGGKPAGPRGRGATGRPNPARSTLPGSSSTPSHPRSRGRRCHPSRAAAAAAVRTRNLHALGGLRWPVARGPRAQAPGVGWPGEGQLGFGWLGKVGERDGSGWSRGRHRRRAKRKHHQPRQWSGQANQANPVAARGLGRGFPYPAHCGALSGSASV